MNKNFLMLCVFVCLLQTALMSQSDEFMEGINRKIGQKDYSGAIADCDKAILMNGPNKSWAYNARGLAKMSLKDYTGAIIDMSMAVELNPENKFFIYSRANAKRIKGDMDGAIADYDKALSLDPNYPEALNYRGRAKYIKGEYDSAIVDYSRAIVAYPNYMEAYSNRGYAYYLKKEYANAYADYYKVQDIDPDNAEVKEKLQILELTPSIYLPKYVQPRLQTWQQKGEFEKSNDYLARVNEQNRNKKINELTTEGLAQLKKEYVKFNDFKTFKIMGYDADNETYKLKHIDLGEIVVKVPVAQAAAFKSDLKNFSFLKPDFLVSDDRLILSYVEIVSADKSKKYIYDITKQPGYDPVVFKIDFDVANVPIPGNDMAMQKKSTSSGKAPVMVGKSDVDINIPVSAKKRENAIAVIFGIENYKNVSSVSYATRDAQYVKEYFNKTLGIPSDRMYYKTNEDATVGELKKVFEGWLQNRVDSLTEVFVYYAGHGAPSGDEKAYLIPHDADPNYAKQTGYALEKLYESLGALKAKHVYVFLDACFSGMNREQKMLLADARAIGIKPKDASSSEKLTVFSAAASNQISSGWPEKSHGLFTYFLLKGLQGEADMNKDNVITVDELSVYIKASVSKQAGFIDREQTPQVKTFHPELQIKR